MEKIWCNKITVVIDEMSIVSQDLFATVDLHLSKAKALYEISPTVLGGLPIVIFLDDFFQFFFVIEGSLWEVPLILHKEHE